jgi:signal transduction histidine kinase
MILFTETFPKVKLHYSKKISTLFFIFPFIASMIALIPDVLIKEVVLSGDGLRVINYGPLYLLYFIQISVYFTAVVYLMIRKYLILKGIERQQVEAIFLVLITGSFVGVFTSLIMPTYGDFSLFWVGSFYSGYLAVAAFYGIIKYGLFDIKLVFTEFITVIIWVFLFIKILLDKNTVDRIIDSVLLLLILVSGYLFIKAVKKEIVLREKDDELVTDVTILNQQLEKTNLQLKELDLKKSEFMSLATHQLRAPLTAMKGYSSMILDGTFGKISNPEIEDAINKISRSTTDLTMIVEDYLNISRIEQGSMRYNFTTSNVSDLLKDVVENVKNTADRLGLIMNLNYDTNTKYNVNVDEGKIKQVFLNIIDNAIKYTPVGEVNIFINKTLNNKVLVKIEDTGVGIKPEVLPNLFNKFVRAPDASKVNILGTGLGLYVAGQILKAHNGRAWGESKGKGEGSKFYVELPGV